MKINTNRVVGSANVAAFLRPQPEVRTMAPNGTLRAGEKSAPSAMFLTVDNSMGSQGSSPPS